MKHSIGDKIHELRTNGHESQEELAQKLNVTRQAISRWENNLSKPDIDMLNQIALIYDKQINWFYEENSDASPASLEKVRSFFLFDTVYFKIGLVIFCALTVVFAGPFSLILSIPNLVDNIRKRNLIQSLTYGFLVFMGVYILLSILFPGLMPHSIKVTPKY